MNSNKFFHFLKVKTPVKRDFIVRIFQALWNQIEKEKKNQEINGAQPHSFS